MPVKKVTRPEGGGVDAIKKEAVREFGLDAHESTEPSLDTEHNVESLGETRVEEESSGAREGESEGASEPSTRITPSIPKTKDPLTQQLEQVLEEDLKDVYLSMSPDKQREFLKKGEEVTAKIRVMIETAKFSFKKALHLIRDWLKIIPGVNKFFLEQETKIKVDKISKIAKGG